MVQSLAFVIAFLALGLGVAFVAFSGGPAKAREAYLTRGRGFFRVFIPIVYIGLGIAVPAVVIANSGQGEGGTPQLAGKTAPADVSHGKTLFRQTCASCHSLAAVNARGITGPNLDNIGQVTKQRVLSAIRIGGTGQGRMPQNLLQGKNAQDVAAFVSSVAGR
jgi:mono/diheme cytochrome c family protein